MQQHLNNSVQESEMKNEDLSSIGKKLESLAPKAKRRVSRQCLHQCSGATAGNRSKSEEIPEISPYWRRAFTAAARRAIVLSDKADEDYFALQGQGVPSHGYLKHFSGLSYRGMGVAFGGSPGEGAHDAVYELSKTPRRSIRIDPIH